MSDPPESIARAEGGGRQAYHSRSRPRPTCPFIGKLADSPEALAWARGYEAEEAGDAKAAKLKSLRFHVHKLDEAIKRHTEMLGLANSERAEALAEIAALETNPTQGETP